MQIWLKNAAVTALNLDSEAWRNQTPSLSIRRTKDDQQLYQANQKDWGIILQVINERMNNPRGFSLSDKSLKALKKADTDIMTTLSMQ